MRKLIVKAVYVVFYAMRHGCIPCCECIDFIADTQKVEPRMYILGNVWRWAEYPAR